MTSAGIENVSDTAFAVAHYRAEETGRADALFRDPLASVLAGDHGRKMGAAMPGPAILSQVVVIRTRIIDDFIWHALSQGVDTVLNLGAGLDTRPYRMDLPESLLWIEVDYPRVNDFKAERLSAQKPKCRLERVSLDLANHSERREFLAATNARAKQLLVLTEGLVSYLNEDDATSLADDVRAMNRVSGWIVECFSPDLADLQKRRNYSRKLQNAPLKFMPKDWFAFFAAHGWRPERVGYIPEEAERLGRPIRLPGIMGALMKFRALFASPARRAAFRRFQGYVLLEPTNP